MLHVLEHTLIDTIKLLPFLFLAYLVIELIEQKAGDKTTKLIKKSGKFGPVLGSLLGIIPQCGFSAAASNLYAGKIITMGTLIAIFLSTSDEMLPILISEGAEIGLILKILIVKVIIGMAIGFLIDILGKKNKKEEIKGIHEICEHEHCNCSHTGILKSSLKHTFQIYMYIFGISLILNAIIHSIGEDVIADFIINIPIIGVIISTLIGIIPNCASSVILTQLYLEQIITFGSMMAGLLVNSGIGILVLYRVNKNIKENTNILLVLFIVGITSGVFFDLLI